MTDEQKELETLRQSSPYALPDNVAESGWTSAQIKEKFYSGLFYLYTLIKQYREKNNADMAELQDAMTALQTAMDEVLNTMAITYVTVEQLETGLVPVLKFLKENGTTETIESAIDGVNSSIATIQGYFTSGKANQAVISDKAYCDQNGNNIMDTYATNYNLGLVESDVYDIKTGGITVGKATNDANGDEIATTYVKVADVVDDLTDTSTSAPLSANQGKVLKGLIDNINTLLSSDDTTLDDLQEVVNYIKNNKSLIDGITSSKISYTDIIDNLTSEISNKPLSANQGKVLKALVDLKADASALASKQDAGDYVTYETLNSSDTIADLIETYGANFSFLFKLYYSSSGEYYTIGVRGEDSTHSTVEIESLANSQRYFASNILNTTTISSIFTNYTQAYAYSSDLAQKFDYKNITSETKFNDLISLYPSGVSSSAYAVKYDNSYYLIEIKQISGTSNIDFNITAIGGKKHWEGSGVASSTTIASCLSNTYKKDLVDETQLATKQATLVSGTNIKTVDSQSLLGSGDIKTLEVIELPITIQDQDDILTGATVSITSAQYTTMMTKNNCQIHLRYVIDNDPNNAVETVVLNKISYTEENSTTELVYYAGTVLNTMNFTAYPVENNGTYTLQVMVDEIISLPSASPTDIGKVVVVNASGYYTLGQKQDVLTYDDAPTANSENLVKSGAIKTYVDGKIVNVYKYQGSVATYNDLPSQNLRVGDIYNVETDGKNYAWDGTSWDDLGGIVDLSNYYTKTEADAKYVDLTTEQTIAGTKTFSSNPVLNNGVYLKTKDNTNTVVSLLGMSSGNAITIGPSTAGDKRLYTSLETHFTSGGNPTDYAYGYGVGIFGKAMMVNTMYVPHFKYRTSAMSTAGKGATTWNLPYLDSGQTYTLATLGDIPTIPTNISTFTNDSGYITSSSLPTKVSDLTNDSNFITLNDVPAEIYLATYGTTTYSEITTALSNGKLPVCDYNSKRYYYYGIVDSKYIFIILYINTIYRLVLDSSSSWSSSEFTFERASNKVATISSASTDTQYPSAKLLYDQLALKQNTLVSGTNIKTINNASILDSGNIDTKDLFYCTYGTTTYAQITQALNDGKLPICVYNGNKYVLFGSTASYHSFSYAYLQYTYYVRVNPSDVWGSGGVINEQTLNKVTSISSSSTNTQYPSAKCVYDNLQSVMEVAEGKKQTYVVSKTTNSSLNSQSDTLTITSDLTDINSNTIDLDDLSVGDTIYITETDVPDRWVSAISTENSTTTISLSKLETAKVPVSDVQVNGSSVVSNNVASITVPTDTSDLTNTAGYITSSDVPQEIYWATYGTTTYAEITSALNAGKIVLCKTPTRTYIFNSLHTDNNCYYFTCADGGSYILYNVFVNQSNVWNGSNNVVQRTDDRISNITSASTNTQYPSAKAVYDKLVLKQDALVSGTSIKTINSTSLLGSGNIDTNQLFVCTYGTTTFADITTAINANKIPVLLNYNQRFLVLAKYQPGGWGAIFACLDQKNSYTVNCSPASAWSVSFNGAIEFESNKVTSISSSSTNTQYPSAKLLYDQLALKQNSLVFNTAYNSSTNKVATMADIPTKVSDLTNDSGFITSSSLPTDYVNTTSEQVVEGVKKFNSTPQVFSHYGQQSKNLFTNNYSFFTNSGGTGSIYLYMKLPDDGKNYTLSVRLKDSTQSFGSDNVFGWTVNGGDFNGSGGWLVQGDTIKTEKHIFYANDAGRCISMYGKTQAIFDALIARYNIQLEEGTEMTEYQDPTALTRIYADVATINDIPTISVNGTTVSPDANNNIAITTGNIPIITTAPSSANTNGLIICVLSSEPATKYDGYLYIITEA